MPTTLSLSLSLSRYNHAGRTLPRLVDRRCSALESPSHETWNLVAELAFPSRNNQARVKRAALARHIARNLGESARLVGAIFAEP